MRAEASELLSKLDASKQLGQSQNPLSGTRE